MFRNILVAIDGSADAEEALIQAIDLPESEHTRLTLMTGIPRLPALSLFSLSGEAFAALHQETRAWVEQTLKEARDRVPDDLPVSTILTEQPIRPALIEQIKRGRHDLVVMSSRGRGAVRSALLGSVSHHVLHHSPVPILIVQAPDRAAIGRSIGSTARADAKGRVTAHATSFAGTELPKQSG